MLLGLAGVAGNMTYLLVSRYWSARTLAIIGFGVITATVIAYQLIRDTLPGFATGLYISMKGQIDFVCVALYIMNLEYFDTLYQSRVFALTNFVGRMAGVLAPFLSATINNPMMIVPALTGVSCICFLSLSAAKQPLRQNTSHKEHS